MSGSHVRAGADARVRSRIARAGVVALVAALMAACAGNPSEEGVPRAANSPGCAPQEGLRESVVNTTDPAHAPPPWCEDSWEETRPRDDEMEVDFDRDGDTD